MSDTSNSNSSRRRNFQGSLPTTNYQMPANFAQKDIQFPKAPSLGQFTPSNSGIQRDWSGSKMPSFKFEALDGAAKVANDLYQGMKPSKPQDVRIVGSEGENENEAPRRRKDGSEIAPFPSFGDDSEDSGSQDSGSSTKKKGATSYNEDGELVMEPGAKWTVRDTGRSAKELFKMARDANRDR